MVMPRMQSYPPYLVTQSRNENVQMLNYSRDYQSPIMMLYRNRDGELSSKLIVVDTISASYFTAQVFAEIRDNPEGERNTHLTVKNFSIDNVIKMVVFRQRVSA